LFHFRPAPAELSTSRIEAFSDGVFAIAITLLVLEIKIPHPADGQTASFDLAHALMRQWPNYFAYVLSFVTIGIYWANHHYIFKLYRKTSHCFILLNIVFLMAISFLPFPTAVLGDFIADLDHARAAVVFYSSGLLLPAVTWFLMWIYAVRTRIVDERLEPAFVRRLTWQYMLSVIFYLTAVALAFFHAISSLVLCVGLTLLYLLPPPAPEYRPAE
jgi:uncharacterized membrane protein